MDVQEIKKITDYIFIFDPLEKAKIGMVFGTRHVEPIKIAKILLERKIIEYVLLSGGVGGKTGIFENQVMLNAAISMGIRKSQVIVEAESSNTLENVLFSKRLLEKENALKNLASIILITKHYHSRRAAMTFKRHFPNHVKAIVHPYLIYGFSKSNWQNSDMGRYCVLSEYKKIPLYLEKGDIEEL